MARKEKVEQKVLTANEFVNVKDIKSCFLFTKDDYVFTYLRIFSINIELLSKEEKDSKIMTQTGEFKSEKEAFSILAIPRSIDLEGYLNFLSEKYEEAFTNLHRKMILNTMIREANEKITNGNNFEHHFYLKIWTKYEQGKLVEQELNERIRQYENRYSAVGVQTKRLDYSEIIRLCNLFSNGVGTINEPVGNTDYVGIPRI